MTKFKCWKTVRVPTQWRKIDSKVQRVNLSVSKGGVGYKDNEYSVWFYGYDPKGSGSFDKGFKTKSQAIAFANKYLKSHDKC